MPLHCILDVEAITIPSGETENVYIEKEINIVLGTSDGNILFSACWTIYQPYTIMNYANYYDLDQSTVKEAVTDYENITGRPFVITHSDTVNINDVREFITHLGEMPGIYIHAYDIAAVSNVFSKLAANTYIGKIPYFKHEGQCVLAGMEKQLKQLTLECY